MNSSLISIILSSHNGSQYIAESIDSVLGQTYTNFELIIINDYSTDNTEEIILKFKKKDTRIIYIKNEKNIKLTQSLNKGINISQGKYIARIDDDDIWLPNKLEKQIYFMETHKDYGLIGTSTIIINQQGKEEKRMLMRETNHNIKNNILKSNQFTHSSVIIRKSILKQVGGYYDKKYNGVEDYKLWLQIGTISKLYNIPEYLVKYRWLKSSIGRINQSRQQLSSIKLCFKYQKYYNHFIVSLLYRIIFYILYRIGTEKKIKSILWKFK